MIVSKVIEYLVRAYESVKPFWAIVTTALSYVMFPHQSYIAPTIALVGALVLDIITKYYALSKRHGGLRNAIVHGYINSNALWQGTSRKVVSYFVIMVLAGLSYRVSPIAQVATFMTTFVYSIMFLREAQSSIENLIYAGHTDLKWILSWLKRKEESVMNQAEKSLEEKGENKEDQKVD
jgi:Ni,Fe-hydrogenase I cytochrome b subunit